MGLTRSEQMARIRGANTEPEVLLWRALRKGRRGSRIGRIKPDLVLSREKVVVFVDGCFWHGCPDHYVRPRGNPDFWAAKLRENTERDTRQTRALLGEGWLVVRFWEHEVRADPVKTAQRVARTIETRRSAVERWRVVAVELRTDELELRTERKLLKTEQWRQTVSERSTAKSGKVKRDIFKTGVDKAHND